MEFSRSFARYWLPAVLWMALIFGGSTGALSSQHTSRFIVPFLRWLKPDVSDETIRGVQFCVRKTGHLCEYAVLAWLLWRARRKPLRDDARSWDWREAGLAGLLATLYAATDEWHQSFVPSRDASVVDVMVDAAGASLGMLVLWQAGRRLKWW
ncbi:MAG: VanZ family protein [Verrucomicrobia bacterium]|nr:VanZ family protein [Verrucomicrobiota bacterium]